MKSWTLIPFYLWKNTCRRWLEYPVSPASKVLIPGLLSFLAIVVLAMFGEVERELRIQLEKSSVYTVYVTELVSGENAPTLLRKSYEDEVMWSSRYGSETVRQLFQPLANATWKRSQNLPVFGFTASMDDMGKYDPEAPPTLLLLSDDVAPGQLEKIHIAGKSTVAETRNLPVWLHSAVSAENVLMAPVEMVEPLLQRGFVNHLVANFNAVDEVREFVKQVSGYYKADRRHVKVVSALVILENLERIRGVQRVVRTIIVMGCGIILALTLGSIAWLEYRQDSFLLALLRSFGTPSLVLWVHTFFENLLLVLSGILIARFAWEPLFEQAAPQLRAIGLKSVSVPVLPGGDMAIIMASAILGVILAMVPVALGLRKPPGLILQ